MAAQTVARGRWCTECEFFESDYEPSSLSCEACGCPRNFHLDAIVSVTMPDPQAKTQEEKVAFRKDWDRRYEEGHARNNK